MSPSPPSAADIKIFTRHSLPFEIIHDSPTLLASCPNNTFSNLPVLLDPGATLNYIDPTLVQQLNLSTEEITQSFAVSSSPLSRPIKCSSASLGSSALASLSTSCSFVSASMCTEQPQHKVNGPDNEQRFNPSSSISELNFTPRARE
ncbi:unnamed protein product [Tilletia controversa]|uniref:Peptidase A2 domain-containing protein n=1 Tax=Tilletia caries TaxID=13290 RepID=A0ABN7J853_9BASI|nr:unnamed protein product [Tilletia controversa]CAD6953501.1 unnamed protein product [Tilletia caries]CAD6972351.1 unnamed protein product [Tilletia controversa]CAD6973779.1 unnamed protein product [Tilletia controversa]CAD7060192.1 unnamed protein product [Tilletia caries]